MKNITPKEIALAGRLLELASHEFSNHGCNDMEEETWGDMTKKERKELIREYYIWNGEPEEAKEGHAEIGDWVLMQFLAKKLKNISK